MADARHPAHRPSLGSLLHPAGLGPRLLSMVARRTGRRAAPGTAAVCATAASYRSGAGRPGGPGPGPADRARCPDPVPGAASRRERAHETVASRTTGAHDLASLLAMLGLPSGPDGGTSRPEDG